jgi:prepilin-type N-terminal cleavage/methylation domain-containing protein
MRRVPARRAAGFTLLEVLVALVVVGTGYMLLARWLLPKRSGEHGDDDYLRLDRYRTELVVVKDGGWSTRPLAELQKALGARFRLHGWLRDDARRDDLTASSPLLAGDLLLVEAAADELLSLHDDPGLELDAIARFGARLDGEGEAQLVQAVVAPGSEFIGRSIRELDFARQFHAVIAGLWRRGGNTDDGRMADARLREGDLLVLYGRPSRFAELASHRGFLLLVPFAGEAKRRLRAPLVLAILGATILAAATEWLPAPLAFLFGAVAMVLATLISARGQHSRVAFYPATRPLRFTWSGAFREIVEAFSERAFLILAAGAVAAYVSQGMTFALANYLYYFVWEFSKNALKLYPFVLLISVIIVFTALGPLHRRFGKRRTASVATLGSMTLWLVPYGLRLAGLWPEVGSETST